MIKPNLKAETHGIFSKARSCSRIRTYPDRCLTRSQNPLLQKAEAAPAGAFWARLAIGNSPSSIF